jgi:hypothetical protein
MALPQLLVECAFNADAGVAYKEAILAGFPLGYWRLSDLTDSSGNAYTLTKAGTVNDVPGALTGDLDHASQFNGTSGQLSHATFEIPLPGPWTIEAWFKTTSSAANQAIFYCPGNVGAGPLMRIDSGKLNAWVVDNGGGFHAVTEPGTSNDGNWHHAVATWDGATLRLYKDGVQVAAQAYTLTQPNTGSVGMSIAAIGGAQFFNGSLDEVAVYASALSADTVEYHYEARLILTPDRWTWTDITPRTKRVTTERGRQNEFDHVDPGTIAVVATNGDRALEPGNPGSTYYPNVVPMKPLRVRADNSANGGSTVPVIAGNIVSLSEAWPAPQWSEIELSANDALSFLHADEGVSFVGPLEMTGARMKRLAQAVGVPASNCTFAAGGGNIAAETLVSANALSHAQDVETTEAGFFFAGKEYSTFVFKDRTARQLSHQASVATFGDADDGSEYGYAQLQPSFDDLWLYSEVHVEAGGLAEQIASDTDSRRQYRRRSLKLSTKHANITDALNAAQLWLARYVQPLRRIESITVFLTGQSPAQMVTDCLSLDLGDRITIVRRPGGAAAPVISVQCNVESIAWTIDVQRPAWEMTMQLSPADVTVYWSLGASGSSELGATTRLSF